ncbi:hypothetical protein SFB3_199G0, partial [Candidatus Arthromitus sp. SFB-3]
PKMNEIWPGLDYTKNNAINNAISK